MTRPRRPRRPAAPAARQVPRTARLNELLREIVAEELQTIDDERLEHVSVTAVDVDADLNRAVVFYDAFGGESADPEVLEAFAQRRVRLQSAIGRQMRARKTPVLEFRPDDVLRSAERIDQILRDLHHDDGGPGADGDGGDLAREFEPGVDDGGPGEGAVPPAG